MEAEYINELLSSQQQYGYDLKTILNNIRDPYTIISLNYIQEKRQEILRIYSEIEINHDKLEALEELSKHQYMTTDYYGSIRKYAIKALKHLNTWEKREKELLTDQEQAPKSCLQKCLIYLIKLKIALAQQALIEAKPIWYIKYILETIENKWFEIERNHLEIPMEEKTMKNKYFLKNMFQDIQIEYEYIKYVLLEKIHSNNSQPSTYIPTTFNALNIAIPIFTGDYEQWHSFSDEFKMFIDETLYSNCKKMLYLKTHVTGEAAYLIQHLHVCEENYEIAWELLSEKYENKSEDIILDLPKIENCSQYQLNKTEDTMNICLEDPKNVQIEYTSSWESIRNCNTDTNVVYEYSSNESNESNKKNQNLKITQPFIETDYNNEQYFESSPDEFRSCISQDQSLPCYPVAVNQQKKDSNKKKNHSLKTTQSFIEMDHNKENDLDLNQNEFRSCTSQDPSFSCFPVAVKKMQFNDNCIIKQLFKTIKKVACPFSEVSLNNNMLWNESFIPNTWIYSKKKALYKLYVMKKKKKLLFRRLESFASRKSHHKNKQPYRRKFPWVTSNSRKPKIKDNFKRRKRLRFSTLLTQLHNTT